VVKRFHLRRIVHQIKASFAQKPAGDNRNLFPAQVCASAHAFNRFGNRLVLGKGHSQNGHPEPSRNVMSFQIVGKGVLRVLSQPISTERREANDDDRVVLFRAHARNLQETADMDAMSAHQLPQCRWSRRDEGAIETP